MQDIETAALEAKEEHSYIFPKRLAKRMKSVDLRTQYEASMMSMTFILIGMILTGVYFSIYGDFKLWFKIVFVINIFCGIIFMSSYLITTYQQYTNYMEIQDFQKSMKGGNEDGKIPTEN